MWIPEKLGALADAFKRLRHFVCDDRGASGWRLTGTTPDEVRVEVQGCDLWGFRDGLVARKDSYRKIVEP